MSDYFRRCSTCKKPIDFGAEYYKCSVSTCNRKRTALYFCSVPCWDAHVPDARHRDAWAEKETAPSREAYEASTAAVERADAPRRRVVSGAGAPSSESEVEATSVETKLNPSNSREVLVVASKLKSYVRERSSMNTSAGVLEVLSEHLRELSDMAIREAGRNERKTVLDRDFEAVLEKLKSR